MIWRTKLTLAGYKSSWYKDSPLDFRVDHTGCDSHMGAVLESEDHEEQLRTPASYDQPALKNKDTARKYTHFLLPFPFPKHRGHHLPGHSEGQNRKDQEFYVPSRWKKTSKIGKKQCLLPLDYCGRCLCIFKIS